MTQDGTGLAVAGQKGVWLSSGFRVEGLGLLFRVEGLGFRVEGLGLRVAARAELTSG